MKISFLSASAMLAVLTTAAPANATTLLFVLSGDRNATFQLDSNPVPTSSQTFSFGSQTVFRNVMGTVNNIETTFSVISFGTDVFADFSATAPGLGFTQFGSGGPIFSGSAAMPVFTPGTYQLGGNALSRNVVLTISPVVSAVPEPESWAMMILGFGAVGTALRRRRIRAAVSYA